MQHSFGSMFEFLSLSLFFGSCLPVFFLASSTTTMMCALAGIFPHSLSCEHISRLSHFGPWRIRILLRLSYRYLSWIEKIFLQEAKALAGVSFRMMGQMEGGEREGIPPSPEGLFFSHSISSAKSIPTFFFFRREGWGMEEGKGSSGARMTQ